MSGRLRRLVSLVALLAGVTFVAQGASVAIVDRGTTQAQSVPAALVAAAPSADASDRASALEKSQVPAALPVSVALRVPYTAQAPTNNWDAAHEEYCEAASVLMVGRYHRGDRRDRIPQGEAEQSLAEIVAFERSRFPGVLDIPLSGIARTGESLFDLEATVAPLDFDELKRHLADGQPVIVPVMTHGFPGRQKIAPYYGDRDVYHVLVLTGYDSSGQVVVANDPGFMQGHDYVYPWQALSAAIDAQSTTVPQGRVMLVFQQRGPAPEPAR